MENITLFDYLLLPFYLIMIYGIAFYLRSKHYPEGHPWRRYFLPALTVKILGAIFIGLIYEYYFGGGDTFNFFFHSKIINSSLDSSFSTWFRLITHQADDSNIYDSFYISQMYWYDDISAYTVASIGAFIGLFSFNKYLIISVLLSTISFTGSWSLFRVFALSYPKLLKYMAFATLFIPSTIMWGSGVFKDTVCITAIGWLTYCFYILFERRTFKFKYVFILLLCIFFLYTTKAYILISFLPILLLKTFFKLRAGIKSRVMRFVSSFMLGLSVIAFSGAIYSFLGTNDLLSKYSGDNLAKTIKITASYLLAQSEKTDGSAYDLGDFEPTSAGVLKKFFPAVNVSLFRPYLWESKKPLMLLAALESLFVLICTVTVLVSSPPHKLFKKLFSDPNILFCLVFALLFAFFTGISSFNFGTLNRYKIPLMPFYIIFLILLSKRNNNTDENVSTDPETVKVS